MEDDYDISIKILEHPSDIEKAQLALFKHPDYQDHKQLGYVPIPGGWLFYVWFK